MVSPRAGKIPPFELIPMLYKKYGTSTFNRRMVREAFGKDAYISVIRALKDGWLQKVRKVDGIYVYMLSGKAMHFAERFADEYGRVSC